MYIRAVAAMPDGQRFLSGGEADHDGGNDFVRVWLRNGTLEKALPLHTHWVEAIVAMPDNQHALSGSYAKTLKLFNVNDGSVLRTFTPHTHISSVVSLALLPDGLRFVSGSNDGTTRIVEHGLAPQVGSPN